MKEIFISNITDVFLYFAMYPEVNEVACYEVISASKLLYPSRGYDLVTGFETWDNLDSSPINYEVTTDGTVVETGPVTNIVVFKNPLEYTKMNKVVFTEKLTGPVKINYIMKR